MYKNYLSLLLLLLGFGILDAQSVAINGTGASADPSSMLDVSATNKGMLVPRMTAAQKTAIVAPIAGLLIYQTDGLSGFWYFNGTIWIRIGNGDGTVTSIATTAPLTGGPITNTGTLGITQANTSTNGFLSSTDWNTFNNKVGGTGVATRVAFWSGTNTISSNANLYWDNTNSMLGVGVPAPLNRLDVASAARTIQSVGSSGTQTAIAAFNTAAAGTGLGGHGVLGQTAQSQSQGVRAEQLNAAGVAISAVNYGALGTGVGGGIYAEGSQSNGYGVEARNINTSGTGLFAVGQNAVGTYLTAGSGAAINGVATGIFARSTTTGIGQSIYTDQFGNVVRVNYWNGAIQYKILGTGTVSTIAEDLNGQKVTLHCTETPEILFEDYGQGKLVNGRAHIEIDPIIAKNITVNEKHPLRVYIQLEGECKGVFVTNKTGHSFDVIELQGGQSNVDFQYHVIGNRADEVLANGRISRNADQRFEPAPLELQTNEAFTFPRAEPAAATKGQ